MELGLFTEFGMLLGFAAVMALVMRMLRQPLIIGHIATGILAGPFALDLVRSTDIFKFLSEIGIAFLLFSVGLNLNPKVLKQYGKIALITGVGQVVFTTAAGVAIALLLGYGWIPSLYIAIALAFSSTIIILKLISDKGDLEKLYAKIAIGFLLVQDLIAIVLLFSIPLISAGAGSWGSLAGLFGQAILLTMAVFLFVKLVLVRLHKYMARSQELLFLVATAWGIGIAVLFSEVGFSLETGALIGGVALSLLPSRHEINARLTPLRDFFIVIFFILLGSQMVLGNFGSILMPAIVFSVLVLIGNPLILMIIMGVLGYRRKTSLQTGFTVAQISEFSLILIALGVSLGHLTDEVLSMVTLVGLATIFGSTYLVLYSEFWYRVLGRYLTIFERKKLVEKRMPKKDYKLFLFGGNRIGFDFIEMFKKSAKPLLVVDHDPEVIGQLAAQGIDHVFGDASDIDFLDSLELSQAELIISTVPDLDINLLILEAAHRGEMKPPVMAVAHSISNALKLYETGAVYVILPHFLGGKYASSIAKRFAERLEDIQGLRLEHIAHLKHRADLGHEHPLVERYR